jgi:hypothetical protein
MQHINGCFVTDVAAIIPPSRVAEPGLVLSRRRGQHFRILLHDLFLLGEQSCSVPRHGRLISCVPQL